MFRRISAGLVTLWLATACSSTPAADALVGKCNTMCMRATSGGCSSVCSGLDCAAFTTSVRARGCAAQYEALLDCANTGDTCTALMGSTGSCASLYLAYYACAEPDAGP